MVQESVVFNRRTLITFLVFLGLSSTAQGIDVDEKLGTYNLCGYMSRYTRVNILPNNLKTLHFQVKIFNRKFKLSTGPNTLVRSVEQTYGLGEKHRWKSTGRALLYSQSAKEYNQIN